MTRKRTSCVFGGKMRHIDDVDVKIIKELIKNPRISDNKISQITKVPVKTVNRKRKKLEQDLLLNYFTSVNYKEAGVFGATHLYIITFSEGVTKENLVNFMNTFDYNLHFVKHINSCYIGEKQGNSTLILLLESRRDEDIVEIFNADIVPRLRVKFGNSIKEVEVFRINKKISLHHNYILSRNVKFGKLDKNWPDKLLFVRDG